MPNAADRKRYLLVSRNNRVPLTEELARQQIKEALTTVGPDVLLPALPLDLSGSLVSRIVVESASSGIAVVAREPPQGEWQRLVLLDGSKTFDFPVHVGSSVTLRPEASRILEGLHGRLHSGLLTLAGRELNLLSLRKRPREIDVPERLTEILRHTTVVLNPTLTYMRRWEMKEKRRALSEVGPSVVTVWNQVGDGEAAEPWTCFVDGRQISVEQVGSSSRGLLLGVVNL